MEWVAASVHVDQINCCINIESFQSFFIMNEYLT